MKKSRFTDGQIIEAITRAEAGLAMPELGVSSVTFYKWWVKYGGMDVSGAKRLKELEAENNRLKRLLAESTLENEVTKDALRKKW